MNVGLRVQLPRGLDKQVDKVIVLFASYTWLAEAEVELVI